MTTGTTSRTAHLLAPMNEGDDVGPGQPGTAGDQPPARRRGSGSGCCRARWLSAWITQHA
jgi:hypothetical protein